MCARPIYFPLLLNCYASYETNKDDLKVEFLSRILWFPSFSGRKLRCCLSLKKILNFVSPDEISWRLLKLKFFSLRFPKIPPQFGYTSSTPQKEIFGPWVRYTKMSSFLKIIWKDVGDCSSLLHFRKLFPQRWLLQFLK